MNRRRYLALVGTATGIAGCSSFGGSETETGTGSPSSPRPDQDPPTDTATASETETPTDTETPTEEPPDPADVVVATQYYKKTEGPDASEAVVGGELENRGEQIAGTVEAIGKFYDDEGSLVDTTSASLLDLAGGETWEVWLPFEGDAADIGDGTLEVRFESGTDIDRPSSVSLSSHSLENASGDSGTPRVTGEARNDGDALDYLEARAKFYDADEVVVASGTDDISNLGAGETWAFAVAFDAYNDDWAERVDSHRVALTR